MADNQTFSTSTSQRNIQLVIRRPDFEFDPEKIPRFYYRNSRVLTHIVSCFNVQVSVFEPFLLKECTHALAHHEIRNPVLRKEVAEFTRQEAIHAVMHGRFNDVLRAHGYPINLARQLILDRLGRFTGSESRMLRAAMGVAGEHLFGEIGAFVLTSPSLTQDLDPTLKALILWHCYEEVEHKSVALEGYHDVFGKGWRSYITRVQGLWLMLDLFLRTGFQIRKQFRNTDGMKISGRERRELLWFVFINPAFLVRIALSALPFLSPRFDPWRHRDNRDHLDRYRSIAVQEEWR
jgi:predicted metal-dependent hydrolase